MTVIRPNSISGINSITGQGGDISIFRADGTAADVTVNNITSGVVTATTFKGAIDATTGTFSGNLGVGGVLTYEDVTNIDSIGIVTARLGINLVGNDLNVGSNIKIGNASGIITATSFRGDASQMTGAGLGTDGGANTSGIITATAFVPTTGQLSHRNLIINGAMLVAQRGTSHGSSGFRTVDRFAFYGSGLNASVTTEQADVASGTTPYTSGFRKSHKITNGAQTGPDAGDYIYFSHKLEAQDIATSGWNYTSASSYVTLSFWVKSSVAQNFYGYLKTGDGTAQNYPFETGSLSANTWTKVTKTIPGNSNLQFDINTDMGIEIVIAPFFGTDKTGTLSLNAWGAWSSSNRLPDNTSTWFTTSGATFEYTGVQLEVGPVATPFEHRSYAEELELCKRYYQQVYFYWNTGSSNSNYLYYVGGQFHPIMRAAPSLVAAYDNNNENSFETRDGLTWRTGLPTLMEAQPEGIVLRSNNNVVFNAIKGIAHFAAEL